MKDIKDRILYMIIATLVVIITIASVIITNNFHSRVAMVTSIDKENNLITVTCGNGNTFSFYDTDENWTCGDLCSLIMFDNGTEIVSDDVVISARYGGYLELFEGINQTTEE